jgi:cold shock CspA family protein
MSTQSAVDSAAERFVGQVKWFNNKAGYGFITAREGENTDKDVFVHYSTISGSDKQYTYLVQGEYVEFSIASSNEGKYEIQAVSVTGVKGGSLMCEARRAQRADRPDGSRNEDGPDGLRNDGLRNDGLRNDGLRNDGSRSSGPRKYRTRNEVGTGGAEVRRRPPRTSRPDRSERRAAPTDTA